MRVGLWRSVMPGPERASLASAGPLGPARAGVGSHEMRAYFTTRLFTTARTPEIPAATWVARALN
jgi:hypothetical protein